MNLSRFRFAAPLPLALLFLAPASAQTPPPPVQVSILATDTTARITAVLDAPLFRHATVGVVVRSLRDGRTLYERNADTALMPASNMKLLTGAVSLATLGPDFVYTTQLLGNGKIESNGTLTGDLILRGVGDPSLTSDRLRDLVRAIKAKGVKRFNGTLFTDTTRFDNRFLGNGWQWDDEADYYQPQISALCCDENVIAITVTPGAKAGDMAQVTLAPPTAYVPLTAQVQTVAKEEKASVTFDRPRARNAYLVTGTVAADAKPRTESLTMEDPARYTATRLWEIMAEEGITVPPPTARRIESTSANTNSTVLAETRSKPLSAMLADFFKPSDNLYGECLLKTMGAQTKGMGTALNGAAAIQDFLKKPGIEVNDGGLVIADGSGLSRNDNVTPRLLVELLTAVNRSFPDSQKQAYYNALPIGGVDGTLRNRFKNTPAQGQVHAKTGSLTGVSSLSGYLITRAGEPLAFSILMNNFNSSGTATGARAAQDAIIIALMDAK